MKVKKITVKSLLLVSFFTFLSVFIVTAKADLQSVVNECQKTQNGKQCAVELGTVYSNGKVEQKKFLFASAIQLKHLIQHCQKLQTGLNNITGCWITLGKPRKPLHRLAEPKQALSIVEFYQNSSGALQGKVIRINFLPELGQKTSDVFPCSRKFRKSDSEYSPCIGKTNIPAQNLLIAWNGEKQGNCQLSRDGKLKGRCRWAGDQARVLDPIKGKIYHGYLQLQRGGCQLKLRGYVGVPMFGRSEFWTRFSQECVANSK